MAGQIWRDTGWFHEPKSATELVETIARLGVYSTDHRFAWRGLSDADFELTSTLYRTLHDDLKINKVTEVHLRDYEKQILQDAREWGLGINGASVLDDFQLLADLQHYGLPTRLIDVTSNPMTALWFAAQDTLKKPEKERRKSNSGLLLAINMRPYDKLQNVFRTVESTEGPSAALEKALTLPKPFVVSSMLPNARLAAQEGYFLASAHPESSNAPMTSLSYELNIADPEVVKRVVAGERGQGKPPTLPFFAIYVQGRLKKQLRSYLKLSYSRTGKVLFPDFMGYSVHGLAKSLEKVTT